MPFVVLTARSVVLLKAALVAAAIGTASLAARFAQDEARPTPLSRAQAVAAKGDAEEAAAILRAALENASPNENTAELLAELERIDPVYRPTADVRRTHSAALLELAAPDRAAGWARLGGAMEALAAELDPAHVRATLGAAAVDRAASNDLERFFVEPDLLPADLACAIESGELQLKPLSGALVECIGERPPQAFALQAEAHHEGDQAVFGFVFDVRDRHSYLRAEIVLRNGAITPRLTAHSETSSPLAQEGSPARWSAASSEWIAIELIFDGERATLRARASGKPIELRVPPRLGAGRLGFFCENGRAEQRTRLRHLRVRELEASR